MNSVLEIPTESSDWRTASFQSLQTNSLGNGIDPSKAVKSGRGKTISWHNNSNETKRSVSNGDLR